MFIMYCSHGEAERGTGGDRDLHTGLQRQTERSVRLIAFLHATHHPSLLVYFAFALL